MGRVYVSNNLPKDINKNDHSVDVRIGVFFDGTSNSYYNTDYRKKIPARIIVMAFYMHMIAIEETIQMSANCTKYTKLKEMILKFI